MQLGLASTRSTTDRSLPDSSKIIVIRTIIVDTNCNNNNNGSYNHDHAPKYM